MKTNYDKITEFENVVEIVLEDDGPIGNKSCFDSPLRVDGECPYSDDDRFDHCRDCIRAWLKEEVKEN